MKDRTYPRRGLHGELVHDIGVRILGGELQPGDSVVTAYVDQSLPGMAPQQRRAIYAEMSRVLSALHEVDIDAAGLSDYGRRGKGYIYLYYDPWGFELDHLSFD